MRLLHVLLVGFILGSCDHPEEDPLPPNLLFIAVDDLRPATGAYGNLQVHTPNMDRLATSGFLFRHHFVTSPTCGASRYTMLRGKLPTRRDEIRNSAIFQFVSNQPEQEEPESWVHHLRRNGYYTVGIGKIPHSADNRVYGYEEAVSDSLEMPYSWDEFYLDAEKWGTGWNAFFGYADGTNRQGEKKQVKPYEMAAVSDTAYPDGLMTTRALAKLDELSAKKQPFVLATGFFKPHLPWTAPKKYWDLYDRETLHLTEMPDLPQGVGLESLHNSGEFGNYELGDEPASLDHPLSEAYQRKLLHAYYACVSYVDAQIGKLLDRLDELNLTNQTMVVLWGDHGWHLGDYRIWGKHTLFEHALQSALIIRLPGAEQQGKAIAPIASTIDLYPTICEVLGVEPPQNLDGRSLVNLMLGAEDGSNRVAYSYFRNGISVRTDQHRYTRYFRDDLPIEVFDHSTDKLEYSNQADQTHDLQALERIWSRGNTGLYDNSQ